MIGNHAATRGSLAMTTIKIMRITLSDGSPIWDVSVFDDSANQRFLFACYSEQDANRFAFELERITNEHTTQTAQLDTVQA
jgi:hypothetical protein